jgi:uncharacterized protein YeaO (DUF488 family)
MFLVANRPGLPAWRGRSVGKPGSSISYGGVMTAEADVRVRRVYDPPDPGDGHRVLVDRLWPRGIAKSAMDEWDKVVAPSAELRRWYGHEVAKFDGFRQRYERELAEPERADALAHLHDMARKGPVTLLTATRDVGHSQAAVLAEWLRRMS